MYAFIIKWVYLEYALSELFTEIEIIIKWNIKEYKQLFYVFALFFYSNLILLIQIWVTTK